MKNIEIENLKFQIISNQPKIRNPTPPPKIPDFCLKTYLNETCKNAINFDEIWEEYILNADHNKWIMFVDNGKEQFNLLKNLNIYAYPKGTNFYVDFFCEPFNKIEHTKKPIFCSDYKRNIYYIKNNNEWNKIEYTELIKKIYTKINLLPNVLLNNIFSLTLNKITEKQFYQIYSTINDFNAFKKNHLDKLILTFCDMSFNSFLLVFNTALKKITSKNQMTYTPSALNANENDLFKDEPDEPDFVDE